MRIQGLGPNGVGEATAGESKKPEPVGPAPRVDAAQPVRVGTGAQRIVSAVTRDERASAEKVSAVRAAVDSGTYRVDFDKLAERIADEEMARVGVTNGSSD